MDTPFSMPSSREKVSQRSAQMSNGFSRNIRQTSEGIRPHNPLHFGTRCSIGAASSSGQSATSGSSRSWSPSWERIAT